MSVDFYCTRCADKYKVKLFVCVYVCLFVCVYVCLFVCVYVCLLVPHSAYWILYCLHADQILPKLSAPHTRLSGPLLLSCIRGNESSSVNFCNRCRKLYTDGAIGAG